MSSPSVEQLKEKLLSCLDEERNVTNMAGALDAVTNLQTVSITRETLEATRLGLLVNDIRRKNQDTNPQLGKLCRSLIKEWQKLVSSSSTQSAGGGKLGVSPGPEKLSTPSGRTVTPRQTVAAKLIAESGLRCSPSPSTTPKLQPMMANGSAQRPLLPGVSPETSRQRGPGSTSSYAPPEQQQQQQSINGPAQSGLKIRIKYGSADQQASIVREIEQAQTSGESTSAHKGAEEAANRRKRKVSSDHGSRTTSGLVNGGSKSVSPCTPFPSPSPSVVENVGSPASVPSADTAAVIAPISKLAKKSKSSSPAPVPSPAPSVTNILQRPKLKSTAELVAEMTSSYPETMSISLDNVVHAPSSPRPAADNAGGSSVMASVLAAEAAASDGSDAGDDDSKDEDYEEPGESKKKAKVMWTSAFIDREGGDLRNVNKAELLDRYLRDHSNAGGEGKGFKRDDKSTATKPAHSEGQTTTVRLPVDWYAAVQLPPVDFSVLEASIDETETDDEQPDGGGNETRVCNKKGKEEKEEERADSDMPMEEGKLLDSCIPDDGDEASTLSSADEAKTNGVQWRSRLLKTTVRGDRQVLALPYVDIGLPDFLEYGYTNRQQYLAHWSER